MSQAKPPRSAARSRLARSSSRSGRRPGGRWSTWTARRRPSAPGSATAAGSPAGSGSPGPRAPRSPGGWRRPSPTLPTGPSSGARLAVGVAAADPQRVDLRAGNRRASQVAGSAPRGPRRRPRSRPSGPSSSPAGCRPPPATRARSSPSRRQITPRRRRSRPLGRSIHAGPGHRLCRGSAASR